METLRIMSRRQGTVSEADIDLFYQEFLHSVKAFGRVFETGLLPIYSFKSKKPFTDLDLAPQVLRKGKLTAAGIGVGVVGITRRSDGTCDVTKPTK